MSKIVATTAVLMLAFAASAVAKDYRSPDATPAAVVKQDYRSPDATPAVVVKQDYRSPDASSPVPVAFRSASPVQDLRSPDARPAGQFEPSAPTVSAGANSFDWGYLALGITAALILLGSFMLTQRRRRHGLAIGS